VVRAEREAAKRSSLADKAAAKARREEHLHEERVSKQPRVEVACSVPGCRESFSRCNALEDHAKKAHPGWAPYLCPIAGCGKRLWHGPHGVQRHVQLMHEPDSVRKIACAFCGRQHTLKANLIQHMQTRCSKAPRGTWVHLDLSASRRIEGVVGSRLTVLTCAPTREALRSDDGSSSASSGRAPNARAEPRARQEERPLREIGTVLTGLIKQVEGAARSENAAQKQAAREDAARRQTEREIGTVLTGLIKQVEGAARSEKAAQKQAEREEAVLARVAKQVQAQAEAEQRLQAAKQRVAALTSDVQREMHEQQLAEVAAVKAQEFLQRAYIADEQAQARARTTALRLDTSATALDKALAALNKLQHAACVRMEL
jgi:hypothetical protein